MAKVEFELPDDLLRQIDRLSARLGETRDELLLRAIERELDEHKARRHKEFEESMPAPIHGGGESGRWIREDRDHRDDKRLGPRRDED